MLVGELKPDNGKDPIQIEESKEAFLEVLQEMIAKGWKSESVFYLNGNIQVKIKTPTISQVTLTGLLIETEKNKPYSIYR